MALVETYLGMNWRVGRGTVGVVGPAPAQQLEGPEQATIYPGQHMRLNEWFVSPTAEILPATWPGPSYPTFVALADAPAGMIRAFTGDYYYRIWVLPRSIKLQNPRFNVNIPFEIWNAYPEDNALNTITGTGLDGLELDLLEGSIFGPIEVRLVNLQITPAAPIQIDAEFVFTFDLGVGYFDFEADIADFVQMVPDPPVTEVWSWLTDIIENRDGSEQRIALRATPRRSTKYSFMLESEDERRRQYNRWFKSLASRIVLPYYQYATALTADVAAGASQLYFDPDRTDLRAEEFALVYDNASENGYLVKLASIEADGAILDGPITFDATTNMIIAPAFTSRLQDRTGFTMRHVTGQITIQAESLVSRVDFKRPGSAAVIPTYDGFPVLDRRPIATGDTPEIFDANYEVVDGQTGIQDLFSAWAHPKVGTTRKWTIRRLQDPNEMDWWRDFFDGIMGQRDPFLMPTWFADLAVATAPTVSTTQLIIQAPDYSSVYFPHETYKRLQIETAGGTIWRKVLSATDNPDTTTTLELDAAFGATAADVDILKVSFLNICRLASDSVTLTHERIRTQVEAAIRTVDG